MSSSRHPPFAASPQRRPTGPRCHGGASSLLRLGIGGLPRRVATARASGWCESADGAGAGVEHIVGLPLRAERAALLAS